MKEKPIDNKEFRMEPRVLYSRIGDMSWNRSLVVMMEGDGDLVIGIGRKLQCDDGDTVVSYPQRLREDELLYDDDAFAMVEFCTSAGRGRSHRVRKAILNLVEAMVEDEKEHPIELISVSEWEKRMRQ